MIAVRFLKGMAKLHELGLDIQHLISVVGHSTMSITKTRISMSLYPSFPYMEIMMTHQGYEGSYSFNLRNSRLTFPRKVTLQPSICSKQPV